jgi:DNA-binding NtrC family response regulator
MSDVLKQELERLLVGGSRPMQELRTDIVRLGRTRSPVLIQGPTGSGKELVARGLHLASGRTGQFVAFNICAVPDSMFEDALFGHVKGAFTGAMSDSAGYLLEADGGTVLLDEINGLSLAGQAKLLRAIESGVFRPVGARHDRRSDFRVLAASNANLPDAVAAGAFRADLYYRLAGFTVDVPALRYRSSDIPELVRHFLAADIGIDHQLLADAFDELSMYTWPGNVRELRHVVNRLTLIGMSGAQSEARLSAISSILGSKRPSREHDEREELIALLTDSGWDTAQVAERLGVHRATVYRRMIRHGLGPAGERAGTEEVT